MPARDLDATRAEVERFGRDWREQGFSHCAVEDDRLISITTRANVRSRAVMERLGFTYGGAAYWHGYDVIWLSVERPGTRRA